MNETKDFDTQLKEMCEIRKEQEWWQHNSLKGKLHQIIVDFKCWAYSQGRFNDLDVNLFAEYVDKVNPAITENMKRYIAERYFGFEFKFNHNDMKWHITKRGTQLLEI